MNRIVRATLAIGALVLAGPLLGGCETMNHEQAQSFRQVAVRIPANLFKCPGAPKKPDFETMTDAQVATYINKLYNARGQCAQSLYSIQDFATRAADAAESR